VLAALDQALARLPSPLSFDVAMVRNGLESCLVYLSYSGVLVRPIIPPTFENAPFSRAEQRLYLSATRGGGGELEIVGAPAPVVAAPAPSASPEPPVPPPAAATPPTPPAAAWPTPAALGGSPSTAAPRPVADIPAASPAPSGAGGLDAAALRTAWTDVLVAVKERKRTAHAQLADAQVKEVTGRTLVLGFQHAPILRQFQASTGPDVLREALQASLGADLDVTCVLHDTRTGSAPPEPEPDATSAEFAPGDEVVPEDPDAPPPGQARGEDAALELVCSQLGGRVVSTSTEP